MKMLIALASLSLICNSSLAQENPVLSLEDSYVLDIPAVDFQGKPGLYSDGSFQHLPELDLWKLTQVKTLTPIVGRDIKTVEVTVTDDLPIQSLIKVTGSFPVPCVDVGTHAISREGKHFNISLFYEYQEPNEILVCATVMEFYRHVFPLPTYGLEAGEYQFTLNGIYTGSFTLAVKNELESSYESAGFPLP